MEAEPRLAAVLRALTSREARAGYAFVLPALVLFIIFRIGPTLAGLVLSFMEYRIGRSNFVGLQNFNRLFADPIFWESLRVTLTYVVISVPLTTVVALMMALLVNQPVRWQSFFRSAFFLPYVTSLIMAGIIWVAIYGPSGPINAIFALLGLPTANWLEQPGSVLPAIAVMSVWKNFGYSMMVLLSGLLAIPGEYYEAAEIDGASSWRKFTSITLPLLKPTLFFVVVIETIGAFQVFDAVYVMTNGGPVRASYTLVYMLYDQGFKFFNFGAASAVGVVLFVIILLISLVQRRFLSERAS
ncbi:sugar ABC transporter permease [Devosia geojensis]|uniref:Sugar ABC transporter permease n=1 Tax=Devosia geojensis TaxID=443610 RepID=A0A0F5FWT9_9HYPH|nr:sugar ABC transporter permease [Devosia geojensis]KKB12637.1 sugar ABC transporter permease [Devosia geojensis]